VPLTALLVHLAVGYRPLPSLDDFAYLPVFRHAADPSLFPRDVLLQGMSLHSLGWYWLYRLAHATVGIGQSLRDPKRATVVGEPVQREIVHDPAVLVAEQRVLDLADPERGDVVRREPLERPLGIRPAELELAHVAHVEAANRVPYRAVLLDDARVLHGHVPPPERNHPSAEADVGGVERSALQRGVGLGHRG